MPFGTAQNKLKKALLFSLVQELKRDVCFRCKKKIETIDDFSIEHKLGWQLANNPIEAFFKLSDVGYSHLPCNVKAGARENKFNKSKTHCKYGHAFNSENTFIIKNTTWRVCKKCRSRRVQESKKT